MSLFVMTTSCELFEDAVDDDCRKIEQFEQTVNIGVNIYTDYGGIPIENMTVKINICKVHCDGHKGYPPISEWNGKTNSTGYFGNGYTSGFKMNTAKDEIRTSVTVYDKYNNVITTEESAFSYWYCKNNLNRSHFDHFKIRIDDKYYTGDY